MQRNDWRHSLAIQHLCFVKVWCGAGAAHGTRKSRAALLQGGLEPICRMLTSFEGRLSL